MTQLVSACVVIIRPFSAVKYCVSVFNWPTQNFSDIVFNTASEQYSTSEELKQHVYGDINNINCSIAGLPALVTTAFRHGHCQCRHGTAAICGQSVHCLNTSEKSTDSFPDGGRGGRQSLASVRAGGGRCSARVS